MASTASDRRPDIDWLRVLATLLVVLFHTAMVFNPAPFYHIRNTDLSFLMVVFCGFVSLWHMPLFFVLAGWSLARAIGSRGGIDILRERAARLGIPLLTGIVLFMPGIKYLELRSGLDLNHRGLWVTDALQQGFRTVIPSGVTSWAQREGKKVMSKRSRLRSWSTVRSIGITTPTVPGLTVAS